MFKEFGDILVTLDKILIQMERSNDLMEKLTKQLEIISLPPDMKLYKQQFVTGNVNV